MRVCDIRPDDIVANARKCYLEDVSRYQEKQEQFLNRNCPGCGGNNAEYFCNHLTFTFDRCLACFSVFMNPGPTEQMIDDLYKNSSNYAFWAREMYPRTREVRRATLHKERAHFVMNSLQNRVQASQLRVLEIGAGTGDSMSVLIQESSIPIEGYVIEPNPDMRKPLEENGIKVLSNEQDIESMDFDVIIAYEVLEHVLNPEQFLIQYSKRLAKTGHFLISTPNAHSLEVQTLKGESTSIDIEHISILSPAAIHSLAIRTGLSVVEITTPGNFDVELMSKGQSGRGIFRNTNLDQSSITQALIQEFCFSSHMKISMTVI